MTIPGGPPPLSDPRKPELALPALACDAHCHIYGPFDRFPLPPGRSFTPHAAPETALRRLHDRLGFARSVIVQSQGHAFDHGPLLDALRGGAGRYRGVALIRPETTAAEIAEFAEAGMCGARFSFMPHLGAAPEPQSVHDVADRVRPHGWHIAIHVAGDGLVEHEAFIRSVAAPVVIDHMGRPDIGEGINGPAITALRRLLDTGRIWVKLSGADRLSRTGAPFQDAAAYAAAIAAHAPERVLWGTDWPHVNLHGPMPDDGDLVDAIAAIAPTPAARQLLLVENPARLFGFA
ncbi:MAG: amidohydrolase family protein [Janthinobacterium lividum]